MLFKHFILFSKVYQNYYHEYQHLKQEFKKTLISETIVSVSSFESIARK
jgi:hypothetical protein